MNPENGKEAQPTAEAPTPKVEKEKAAVVKPLSKTLKLSDGTEITIHKLKAGRYYKAQKVFSEWIQQMFGAIEEANSGDTKLNPKDFLDADGKPDEKKIEKSLKTKQLSSFKKLISVSSETGQYKLDLVALSLNVTIEEIEEKYYAEDIERIVKAVIVLNDFISNLKNSAAPMSGLGATA